MPDRLACMLIVVVLGSAPVAAAQPASPAPASAAPPASMGAVTVVAPASPKTIRQQTHAFVQGYAAAQNPEIDQIGRWRDPVCVEVMGLSQASQAAMIEARIESVAQAVGLPAARPGCKANVQIAFTDQPQRMMDAVAQHRQRLLGYDHLHDRDRLKQVYRPIQSWYVTATTGDGRGGAVLAGVGFSQPLTEVLDDPTVRPPNGCADSRIGARCLESKLKNVFVLADSKALDGEPLGLVADYMALLALSEPRSLDGCNALPSVIDLFARSACGRDTPDGLTPADAAYLTSLYAANLRARKPAEQADIASRMARILIKADVGGRAAQDPSPP